MDNCEGYRYTFYKLNGWNEAEMEAMFLHLLGALLAMKIWKENTYEGDKKIKFNENGHK